MFRAAQRWAAGEDLQPLVQWSHAVGANLWRVFLQYYWLDPAHPFVMPLDQIVPFVQWVHAQGLRVEAVIGTDFQRPELGMLSHRARRERIGQVLAQLVDTDCTELVNEPLGADKNMSKSELWQIIDELGLDQPSHRPCLLASGDYDELSEPTTFRVLDYLTDHPERKPDWPAEAGKTGHFLYDGFDNYSGRKVPIVEDEPIGCAEVAVAGRRDNRLDAFEDGGAGFGIGASGATFHCDDGIAAIVPGPVQTACAQRFFAAMDYFPTDTFSGRYVHDRQDHFPLEPTDEAGEVAGRWIGGQCRIVAAQPTSAWHPVPKPGHRIVQVLNTRGNALVAE